MLCLRCGKRQAKHGYCRQCLGKIIVARARKILAKEDTYVAFGKGWQDIASRAGFVVEKGKEDRINGYAHLFCDRQLHARLAKDKKKALISLPIDAQLQCFLQQLFKGKGKLESMDPIPIPATKEELYAYSGQLYKSDTDEARILDKMESRYPGSKFSLYNAFRRLSLSSIHETG